MIIYKVVLLVLFFINVLVLELDKLILMVLDFSEFKILIR